MGQPLDPELIAEAIKEIREYREWAEAKKDIHPVTIYLRRTTHLSDPQEYCIKVPPLGWRVSYIAKAIWQSLGLPDEDGEYEVVVMLNDG